MPASAESVVLRDFDRFRHSPESLDVALRLWMPDADAVAFAWVGRLHNLFLGRAALRLRSGILPGRFRGRLAQGTRACKRHARVWVREIPQLYPSELLQLIRDGLADATVAARTEFLHDGRLDLILAIAGPDARKAVALVERRLSLKTSHTAGCRWYDPNRIRGLAL